MASLVAAFGVLAVDDRCCVGACAPPLQKYYSVDVKHGFCGECCMDPKDFDTFHRFEKNLTKATEPSPCKDQFTPTGTHYTQYDSTVTHGFLKWKMTLDLYAPGPTAQQPKAASYPDRPWIQKGSAYVFETEIPAATARAMVPSFFDIVASKDGTTKGAAYIAQYTKDSTVQYSEAIFLCATVSYNVSGGGKPLQGSWVGNIYVDSEAARDAGREVSAPCVALRVLPPPGRHPGLHRSRHTRPVCLRCGGCPSSSRPSSGPMPRAGSASRRSSA